eukprot:TRINITY_DN71306_c0_g1_i1.p1 TRINITY_DN71306_c0_g1~~TRINITY_DN71306_c0_g1_i1.p1  ORF type:complete len:453 (+),score=107.43 TRINITY_DN71306_c0_g1_i1:87-1361(+)
MVVAQGEHSDEEEQRDEAEVRRQQYRDEDYLDFRRKLDEMKRVNKVGEVNSDKLREQGNSFFSLGCYEQASIIYSEAILLRPDHAVLYCNRAMAYLKMGLADQALDDAEKSLIIDRDVTNIKAYWRKAQALFDLERPEDAEAAADEGLALAPANSHLNTVRRKAREASVMRRLVGCEWVGKLEQGIEKRLTFKADGVMDMCVLGHTMPATFDLSVEGNPRSMYVKMKPEGDVRGTGPPAPPVPYIFEFKKAHQELWLCHPVNSDQLPDKFEGPGFVKMRREAKKVSDADDSRLPVDERAAKYIEKLNGILPIVPVQLPARPSDEDVAAEVLITEKMAKLKRSFGLTVHQRAVELAKHPELAAPDEKLQELSRGLQQRFIARKIFPPLAEEPQLATTKVSTPPTRATESGGCLAGLVARICKGKA